MTESRLRECKVCKGEFLKEWNGDTHKVCPDCRPGLHNTTLEERDVYTQAQTHYGRRLIEGFALIKGEDDK